MAITLNQSLKQATKKLKNISNTPELDAEVLLTYTLTKSRSYLYTHQEEPLTEEQLKIYDELIKQREAGKPIAYITGSKGFWNLELIVDERVLIPRPETELVVETLLKILKDLPNQTIADIGTGSGAIALAIAKEKPQWQLYATDISAEALTVAKANANHLQLTNIEFSQGNALEPIKDKVFNAIVSNPPYIAEDDALLEDFVKHYEPAQALIAKDKGLAVLSLIIKQASACLKPKGVIVLEHGHNQAKSVAKLLEDSGFKRVTCYKDLAGLDRVTAAEYD